MQVSLFLWVCHLLMLGGLLCLALSQPAHSAQQWWFVRLKALGLNSAGQRSTAGVSAILLSAVGMATLEGLGMGLVLWVLSGSFNALLVAWGLSCRGTSAPQRD